MQFQFYCPGGHLLSGEPEQSGQLCHCPICGTAFIIPPAPGMAISHAPEQQPGQILPDQPVASGPDEASTVGEAPAQQVHTEGEPVVDATVEDAPEQIVHIPCPNGHELETPMEMIGQDVMCPHCQAQFQLRYEDSIECKEQRREELEHREHLWGKRALQWAIIAAALIVLGLLGLIVVKMMDK